MKPSIVTDFKQTPVYAGMVIGSEILFVTVAIGLGMFTQVFSYLAASAVYVAARLNGKGEGWRYLLQLSGSELSRTAWDIAKSSPSSINSVYSYDWSGKERHTDRLPTMLDVMSSRDDIEGREGGDCVAKATGDAQSANVQSGVEPIGPEPSPVN